MLIHRRTEPALSAGGMGLPVTGAYSSCSRLPLVPESESTAICPSHTLLHHSCSPGQVENLPSPALASAMLHSSETLHPRALLDDGVIISRRHYRPDPAEGGDARCGDEETSDVQVQNPGTSPTSTNQHSSSGVDSGSALVPYSPRTKSVSSSFLTSASRRRQAGTLSAVPTRNARSETFPMSLAASQGGGNFQEGGNSQGGENSQGVSGTCSLTDGPSCFPTQTHDQPSTGLSQDAPAKRLWSKTLLGRHLHSTSSSLRSITDDAESAGSSPSAASLVSSPLWSVSARFSGEARASTLGQQGGRGSVSLHYDSCQAAATAGECNGQPGTLLDDSPPESNPTTPRLPHRKHSPMSSFVKAFSVNSGPAGSSSRHSEQEKPLQNSRSQLPHPKLKSASDRRLSSHHQRSNSDPADGDLATGPALSGQSKGLPSLARQVSRLLSHHWSHRTPGAMEGSYCVDNKQQNGHGVETSFREELREGSLSVDFSDGRVTAGTSSSRTVTSGEISPDSMSDVQPLRNSTVPSQSRPGNATCGGGQQDMGSVSFHGTSRRWGSALAEEITSVLQGWSISGSMATLKDYLLDPEEIEMGEVIAVGASGEVSRATFRGETVAVKVLKKTITKDMSRQFFMELRREVCTFVSCSQCPQLLQFCGLFVDSQSRVGLVTRYMEGGTLYKFLRQRQRKGAWLSLVEIVRLAKDIAQGMFFLHAKGVIHRDLKSENVLLSGEGRAVICDFGMARLKDDQGDMTNEVGTYRWMAPEAFGATNWPVTKRADVYSFGIILWELVTLSVPFEKMNSMQAAMAVGMKGQRPPIPVDCNSHIKKLIQQCWVANPDHRPDFSDILYCLNGIKVE